MPRKKTTRKKKTTRRKSSDGLGMSNVVKTNSLSFREPPKRGTRYQKFLDRMASLRRGQSFTVPIPEGVEPRTMHNRLNAVLRRHPVDPPKGCVFRKRTTTTNRIAISCEKA